MAGKTLALRHDIWERIEKARRPPPNQKRELVGRFSTGDVLVTDSRIEPAKPLTKVEPEYTKPACIARFDGTATVAVLIRSKAFRLASTQASKKPSANGPSNLGPKTANPSLVCPSLRSASSSRTDPCYLERRETLAFFLLPFFSRRLCGTRPYSLQDHP